MNANLKKRTIEMTKSEAKAAGRIGSDKFNELREYQTAYPTFTINIVATPKRKSQFKGLTYEFMAKYIRECNKADKDVILEKFNDLTGSDSKDEDVEVASYLDVKKWFLKKFPEIEEFKENQRKKIEAILCE